MPVLINAFKIIHKKHPQTKLTIIGDGPAFKDLKNLVCQENLAGSVIFTGSIPHDQLINSNLISSGDVFITPSKTENQPMSLLEAMAFGLPIIGVDALGMPELVHDNENGFLVQPDNSKKIAQHAIKLIENRDLANKLGLDSLKLIKKYSLTKTAEELEKAYTNLVNEK